MVVLNIQRRQTEKSKSIETKRKYGEEIKLKRINRGEKKKKWNILKKWRKFWGSKKTSDRKIMSDSKMIEKKVFIGWHLTSPERIRRVQIWKRDLKKKRKLHFLINRWKFRKRKYIENNKSGGDRRKLSGEKWEEKSAIVK